MILAINKRVHRVQQIYFLLNMTKHDIANFTASHGNQDHPKAKEREEAWGKVDSFLHSGLDVWKQEKKLKIRLAWRFPSAQFNLCLLLWQCESREEVIHSDHKRCKVTTAKTSLKAAAKWLSASASVQRLNILNTCSSNKAAALHSARLLTGGISSLSGISQRINLFLLSSFSCQKAANLPLCPSKSLKIWASHLSCKTESTMVQQWVVSIWSNDVSE